MWRDSQPEEITGDDKTINKTELVKESKSRLSRAELEITDLKKGLEKIIA